jgi:hypothetical protein
LPIEQPLLNAVGKHDSLENANAVDALLWKPMLPCCWGSKAMGSMALELREKVGWQPHLLHRLHPHIIDTMTRWKLLETAILVEYVGSMHGGFHERKIVWWLFWLSCESLATYYQPIKLGSISWRPSRCRKWACRVYVVAQYWCAADELAKQLGWEVMPTEVGWWPHVGESLETPLFVLVYCLNYALRKWQLCCVIPRSLATEMLNFF